MRRTGQRRRHESSYLGHISRLTIYACEPLERRVLLSPLITGVPNWTSEGPTQITGGQARLTTTNEVSGAVTAILMDPRDPTVMYIGTAGGGVWKTTGAGLSPVS